MMNVDIMGHGQALFFKCTNPLLFNSFSCTQMYDCNVFSERKNADGREDEVGFTCRPDTLTETDCSCDSGVTARAAAQCVI